MCSILLVSRSGFYDWKHLSPEKAKSRYNLLRTIEKVHQGSRKTYGSPRIYRQLKGMGFSVSKSTVERIMREYGIKAKKRRKYRVTTDSKHSLPISPNLVDRVFDRGAPNKVWLSDITYLPTNNGWAYLATVMDAHTRKIVGWSVADNMKTNLVLSALELAIGRENPESGTILHSDRGSQYASSEYRSMVGKNGFLQSMSRKGNCWDNAPMESFFDTLKTEHVYHENYKNTEDVRRKIFEWIEVFYNRERIHSSLGYVSPSCFHERHMAKEAA